MKDGEPDGQAAYEGWAILELMGHRTLPGYVSFTELGGAALIRIDVLGASSQFYSPSALYCLTPCTREAAEAAARRYGPRAVGLLEVRGDDREHDEDDDDDDDACWLCACGQFEESGLHCSECHNEPPWGCDCGEHDVEEPDPAEEGLFEAQMEELMPPPAGQIEDQKG